MDRMHRTLNWMDHNRWTLAAMLAAAAAVAWLAGCESTTASLTGSRRVTRLEFEAERLDAAADLATRRAALEADLAGLAERAATLEQRGEWARADLDRQDALRASVVEWLGGGLAQAAAGTLEPTAFIVPGLSLLAAALGVGKTLDNRRKDKVIAALKAPPSPA